MDPCYQWLMTARDWSVTAQPVFAPGERAYAEQNGYRYQYFSPMRPLNFVSGVDCVLAQSTEPYHDFIYTRKPLTNDRIYKWELVPCNQAAWDAVETELNTADRTLRRDR